MTPNFALDLSEDGIVLLHRSPTGGGWFREGRVDFATDDIAEGLSQLRARAIELEGEEFHTKLILPSSQLLFTTVSAETDIAAALEERTPYRADQLSYTSSGEGDHIKVVAVALETLGEAEGFIAPHGLNPVGFTAIPQPHQFDGEPMLGGTLLGADGFDPDPEPINVIEKPTFLPDPVAPMEDEPEEPQEREAEAPEAAASEGEPVEDEPQADEPETEERPAEDVSVAETPEDVEPADEQAGQPAAFSSRRRGSEDSIVTETDSRVTKLAARIAVPDPVQNAAPKLGAATPKPAAPVAPKIKSVAATKPVQKPVPVVPPPPPPLQADRTGPATVEDPIAKLAAQDRRGKPRYLGLILTAILLVCLGLAAMLSSYVLPDNAVSRFIFGSDPETEIAADTTTEPALIEGPEADISLEEEFDLASLPMDQTLPDLTDNTSDFLPAETVPAAEPAQAPRPEPFTEADAEVAYAATGIWQHAATLGLDKARPSTLDDLYVASLDPDPQFEDAPALLPISDGEVALVAFTPPPPAGVIFDIDERGLVRATPEGALNPEGIIVYLGAPPVRAIQRPDTGAPEQAATADPETPATAEAETEAPQINAQEARLAAIRPTQRPANLTETQERATLGGLSRAELAAIRPLQRPASAQAQAEAIARALAEAEAATQAEAEAALVAATAQAVTRSLRAQQRPGNFERVVAQARATPRDTPAAATARTQTASASTAAPSRATGPAVARSSRAQPTGRVSTTVARAATDNNAIALGKVALVGVFGTSSNRSALVRMPNGRFKKVSIGDRVDGGRVAGIDSNSLRYVKGGRSVTLQMPKG
ncbi:MAG: hypothetical protein AAGA08_11795 [Pseudomonadota bacterium]